MDGRACTSGLIWLDIPQNNEIAMKKNKNLLLILAAFCTIYGIYYWMYKIPSDLEQDAIQVEVVPGQFSNLGAERKGAEIVHFYAHWCGPCIREIRQITKQYEALQARGLDFVFLTDDTWEEINQMRMLLPSDIKILKIASLNEIGVRTIPTTYVINPRNEIVFQKVDACNWEDAVFLQEINQLLESK